MIIFERSLSHRKYHNHRSRDIRVQCYAEYGINFLMNINHNGDQSAFPKGMLSLMSARLGCSARDMYKDL